MYIRKDFGNIWISYGKFLWIYPISHVPFDRISIVYLTLFSFAYSITSQPEWNAEMIYRRFNYG